MKIQLESPTPLTPTRTPLTSTRSDCEEGNAVSLPLPLFRTRDSASGVTGACSTCHLKAVCLPAGLTDRELQELKGLIVGRRTVREGESLFLQGQPLTSLYAVRLGCFKTSMTLIDGSEHVTGFALAGDVLGFDALASEVHSTTATALEDADACILSYDAVMSLPSCARGGLRRRLYQIFGAQMMREQWLMALIGHTNSEPRVAAFLLLLSRRMEELGFSRTEFNLRMSRTDIGSYLGLSVEGVSRAFSAFADRGLIEVRRRRLRLLDSERLARVSESVLPGSCQGFAKWEPRAPAFRGTHPPLNA